MIKINTNSVNVIGIRISSLQGRPHEMSVLYTHAVVEGGALQLHLHRSKVNIAGSKVNRCVYGISFRNYMAYKQTCIEIKYELGDIYY